VPLEVIEGKEVPLPVVKKILEKRLSEEEPSLMQRTTYDHAVKFSKLSPDKALELVEKLQQEFGLSGVTAVQIVNVMPKTIDELRTLMVTENRIFLPSELEKMLSIILSYSEEG